ncbi:hypothetical protein ACNRBV_09550 [Ralstonia pseudosolanacearum]
MSSTRRVQRSKKRRLTDDEVTRIASLIKGQPSTAPMTWEDVVRLVDSYIGHEWSRQTLQAHGKIKSAYDEHARRHQQHRATGKAPATKAPEIVVLQQKLEKERMENATLRETLREYDERLCTYLQNAISHGLTPEQLGAPLIAPYRAQTEWDENRRKKRKGED